MAFYESPRFPERIAYGAQGGPEWSTTVVVTVSGKEQRAGAWTYPRHRWDVSQGIKTQADFEALRAHFMTVRGRLHGWRFKDWAEFQCLIAEGKVSGLTGTTFQLLKRYTSGAQTMTIGTASVAVSLDSTSPSAVIAAGGSTAVWPTLTDVWRSSKPTATRRARRGRCGRLASAMYHRGRSHPPATPSLAACNSPAPAATTLRWAIC